MSTAITFSSRITRKEACTAHTRAKMAALPAQRKKQQSHTMTEERLENIETKLSFQEDLVEELNKAVYQQQQKIERLEALCQSLAQHVQSLSAGRNDGGTLDNERPPHY